MVMMMSNYKLTDKDIKGVQLRGWMYQWLTFNYETMQSPGWVFAIGPALEKLYGDNVELLKEKFKKHFNFYNTHPWMHNIILGACLSVEESKEENCTDTAVALRTGLMGPFAGLGDSLFFVTGKVILNSIAGYMAINGSAAGLLIIAVVMAAISVVRYRFFWIGYKEGLKFITTRRNELDMLTEAAIILGLVVIGAMIPSMVKVATPLVFTSSDAIVEVQMWINSIIPGLLPVLTTAAIFYGLGIKKMTTVRMVWLIIAVAIALTFFKVL